VSSPQNILDRLTRLGFSCDASPAQLRSAREHFEQHDYVRMPGFIEPGFFRVIQRYLRGATFEERDWNSGHDLTLINNPLHDVFHVLLNDPKLFRLLVRVTGCRPIGCFKGRLYRMVARKGLLFDWHPDIKNNRKLAPSINLSDAPYRGGTLELRERSGDVREVVPNLGFGDAIVFRVAEHLEHRLTPVVGKIPKTAVAGFFCSRPKYSSVGRALIARPESALAARAIRRRKGLAFPSPHDVVKIPPAVVSQTTGRETFLANIATSMCYGLDETGGRIWELLAQGHAMHSVSATIASEYGAPRRDVERNVLALAHQLAQRDLVKVVHPPTTDAPAR
jgi:hypothetical protein